jgi:predicted RNA-binding protein with RPS1 domain
MVHISELADYRVANIEDEVKVGDEITVKVIKNEDGKIGLSRRAAFENPSQPSGAGARDSLSTDYPFKKQREVRSAQRPYPPGNKQYRKR